MKNNDTTRQALREMRLAAADLIESVTATKIHRDTLHAKGKKCWLDRVLEAAKKLPIPN